MNPQLKEHLISATYTFLTGFLLVVVPELSEMSLEELKAGALAGVLLAGARAGLKMLGQMLLQKTAQ